MYKTVQCSTVQYSGVQKKYSGIQNSTVVNRIVQWCTEQYSGVQNSTVVYRTVHWCTEQYSGVQDTMLLILLRLAAH